MSHPRTMALTNVKGFSRRSRIVSVRLSTLSCQIVCQSFVSRYTEALSHSLTSHFGQFPFPFSKYPPPHRAAFANETHFQTSFRGLWTNHGLRISREMWSVACLTLLQTPGCAIRIPQSCARSERRSSSVVSRQWPGIATSCRTLDGTRHFLRTTTT
ncbi:hypothetical protein BDP81DRAFT_87617 [Colletotrichum phormii]|uniref:C2H2-type domain-containing protein n=1 Tax=Colletotrichum phormii TaxID=359342 RepID=A0AAJ0A2F5_9PEZI|nr:uncharacterized protein BDP81DRAFT_87617 [Colletotrichum phormii]KAK1654713.1 hypothetical protein BDP81DRAFT_87617 [Colletotrichum phormii]